MTERNLLMDLDEAATGVKFVLHDRDASFSAAFDAVFQAAGISVIRSAVQRWIGNCLPPRPRAGTARADFA